MLAQSPALTITSASGDSTFTAYGILDVAVARVAHDATFSDQYSNTGDPRPTKTATSAVTGMMNGGLSGDRFGFKGGTAIGGDWKALFQLEMGINIINGNASNGALSLSQNASATATAANVSPNGAYSSDSGVSGQLFGRAAFFGLGSPTYGTITGGRNTTFFTDLIPDYDPTGGAQEFSPIGYSSTWAGGGGETDSARLDNSLKYIYKAYGFDAGWIHKFGGVSGSTSSRSADNLIAGYDGGFWGVQVGYMTVTDNTALSTNTVASNGTSTVVGGVVTYTVAPTVATLKATFYDTKATLLMAKYKVGGVWIKGGYQHIEYTNPSNPTQDATLTSIYGQSVGAWSTTPLTIGGAAQTKKLDVMWLGGNYDVTAKFNVALGWFEIRQNDFSNGTATAADKSGNGKFGSIILDYHLSKPFDVYAGYMNSQYNEGLAAGYPLASNNIFGLGARYSF
jgi:predicted porin